MEHLLDVSQVWLWELQGMFRAPGSFHLSFLSAVSYIFTSIIPLAFLQQLGTPPKLSCQPKRAQQLEASDLGIIFSGELYLSLLPGDTLNFSKRILILFILEMLQYPNTRAAPLHLKPHCFEPFNMMLSCWKRMVLFLHQEFSLSLSKSSWKADHHEKINQA